MALPKIKHVRAFVVRGGGADYHDQGAGHWIDDHIATPMSRYPEYRQSRQSFGINILGTLVVEIEADDGTIGFAVTTGEHEATRWGFRMLLEMGCCDIIQPDVGWCGGVTELLKISALADAHGKLVIPHGSSVYSYHFVITRHNSPFAEFLMMHPGPTEVVPMFSPQLLGEPVPVNGRMRASALDQPGFGVTLNPDIALHRPYMH